ncbi:MAG: very short patch repair endonuclease [Aeromicrobium sp.]|uniref:very short patch repair endonuclease n=1 Tax=Aeromicrobium sp. TaxID=1871063 RepID=UPI0039E48D58
MPESWASSEATRKSMRANRSRDTSPELAVRRLVHAKGLRYRVAARPEKDLRRTVDLMFGPTKVVVLIDGCYWHGCPDHYRVPATNRDYWSAKIDRNRERDRETTAILTERGWTVLRFWEHEPAETVAARIEREVRARRTRQ